jgi:murein DD-endopeptidase MepM/ murein hydrolase activator NlpD
VALAGDFFFSGGSVFLDHGDGLISMYFHLQELAVEQGRDVKRGEVIGSVGQTGRATGPHLHMGLRWRGARIDPSLLLVSTEQIPTIPG